MKQIKTTIKNPSTATSLPATSAPSGAAASVAAASGARREWANEYQGVPYADIVAAWLGNRGIEGDVAEGARNTVTYQMARDLRYICDFDVDFLLHVIPNWGLTEEERRRAVESATASPRGTELPKAVTTVVAQCQRALQPDAPLAAAEQNPLPEQLPPLLQTIRRLHPRFPKAALLASLPALGTLLSNLRARYADGEWQSPIFFTVIQAPQASGKSFARRLSDWLVRPIKDNDQRERLKEQQYKDSCKKAKNAKEQPEEPAVVIRCLPATVSNAVLLKRADKAQGRALYTFAEEIDTIARGNKAGTWSAKNDIYRMAFDGAEWGQDYMAENSYAAVVELHYNLLFLGTPLAVSGFFKKVEDGMASRFMLAQLPDTRGEALQRPVRIPKAQQERADALIQQAYDEGGQQEEQRLQLPKTLHALDHWHMERISEFNADPDNMALDILRRRAGVLGFRAAMVAWWLCGKEERQEGGDFALWGANEVLCQQLAVFGEEMNRIERESMEITQQHNERSRMGRNGRLLKSLPDAFTKRDVEKARQRMGRTGECKYVISRWVKAGLIEPSPDGKSYVKLQNQKDNEKKV